MRDFNEWMNNLKESIVGYDYYIDFETVRKNTVKYKKEIEELNKLVDCDNIKEEFINLISENKKVLKVIPLLLAKREKVIFCKDDEGERWYNFDKPNQTIERYAYFMEQTGLFSLLSTLKGNLFDYVIGVNTGLNANARKNRGGHLMEDLVEKYLQENNYDYQAQMYLEDIEEEFGVDLSPIHNSSTKRFDFVVKVNNTVYGIECNFFNSQGSKLNEVARSYQFIAEKSKNIENFEFIWITDGTSWFSAKNNLKDTFDCMEHLYNIKELEEGILKNL